MSTPVDLNFYGQFATRKGICSDDEIAGAIVPTHADAKRRMVLDVNDNRARRVSQNLAVDKHSKPKYSHNEVTHFHLFFRLRELQDFRELGFPS
jgi:hypothetical protein